MLRSLLAASALLALACAAPGGNDDEDTTSHPGDADADTDTDSDTDTDTDADTDYEGDDAGECSDGADNDRDGDFDCDDADCAGSAACADPEPVVVRGDVHGILDWEYEDIQVDCTGDLELELDGSHLEGPAGCTFEQEFSPLSGTVSGDVSGTSFVGTWSAASEGMEFETRVEGRYQDGTLEASWSTDSPYGAFSGLMSGYAE
jgi:hypothetical protein